MNLNATLTSGGMDSAAFLVAAKFSPQKTAAKIRKPFQKPSGAEPNAQLSSCCSTLYHAVLAYAIMTSRGVKRGTLGC